MRQREKAVLGLAAATLAYEIWCDDEETISDFADDMLERYPRTTAFVGAVIVGHVFNVWENYQLDDYDIIHRIASLKGRTNE